MFPTWLEHETKDIGKSHDNLPVIVIFLIITIIMLNPHYQSSSPLPCNVFLLYFSKRACSLLKSQVIAKTLLSYLALPSAPHRHQYPTQKRQITRFVCVGDSTVQVWLCDTAVHKYNNGFSNEVADTKTPHSVNRFHDFATSQREGQLERRGLQCVLRLNIHLVQGATCKPKR